VNQGKVVRSKLNLLKPLVALLIGCALVIGAIGLVTDRLASQPAVAGAAT
jgi:hypothetical protein